MLLNKRNPSYLTGGKTIFCYCAFRSSNNGTILQQNSTANRKELSFSLIANNWGEIATKLMTGNIVKKYSNAYRN